MKYLILAFMAMVAGALAAADPASAKATAGQGKPNIILILADDLGYGELGSYGGPVKTPHIALFAQKE